MSDMRKFINILNESGNPYDRTDAKQNRQHAAFNRGWDSETSDNPYDKKTESERWTAFNQGHAHRKESMDEQADGDNMYGDSSVLDTFGKQDGQEFTDRGRGNVKPRANMDARFADNPMDDEQLDEFIDVDNSFTPKPDQLDRLHSWLLRAGQTDQSIMQGVDISSHAKQKAAARLGVSPDVVTTLIASLIQNLRDADEKSVDAITDDYYTMMGEGTDVPMVIRTMPVTERKWIDSDDLSDKDTQKDRDATKKKARAFKNKQHEIEEGTRENVDKQIDTIYKHADNPRTQKDHATKLAKVAGGMMQRRDEKGKKRPFDEGAITELFSYEPDALGNVTIRDSETGNEKYIQGTQATTLLARLRAGANPNDLLSPLMEAIDSDKNDFKSEIKAKSGTYNFPWKYGDRHGLATAMYTGDEPSLSLISVRTDDGNEVDYLNGKMHADLKRQAKDFIGHE